ncbi:MAG: glycosyltransferase, partial [Chloroflexi bacterium]|nr:glycosyltransferase [Chloroflexota bacterium]
MSISVVMPVFNGARYIAEAIESVLTQTAPADEIIVINDGSNDESAAIAERYGGNVRVTTQAAHNDWGPTALALLLRLLFLATWLAREMRPSRSGLKSFVLGLLVGVAIFEKLSSLVLLVPLALMSFVGVRQDARINRRAVLLGLPAGCAPLVLTNATGLHHWIIGTPFQYTALVLLRAPGLFWTEQAL